MNWRNVLLLISVDVKASRMFRGAKFRGFRENKVVIYGLYIAACILGLLVGFFFGNIFAGIPDKSFKHLILEVVTNLFITLPTIALLYGLIFTQIGQIQRIGAKITVQPLYWFPITWKEHTLASIIANVLGAPLIITVFICSAIVTASLHLGLLSLASITVLALLFSLFLASITTEAFIRRRELMQIFVLPVVVIIMPILSTLRGGTALPPAFSSFLFVYLTLLPGGLIAYSLGNIIIGSEGGGIWLLHSLPVSAKSLVKAKYAFIVLFSLAVILVCSVAAYFIIAPSIRAVVIGALDSMFLAFALGMVSLVCGIKGADFQELPRPKMIKPLWSLLNMAICAVIGLTILAPMIPYGLQKIFSAFMVPLPLPGYYPYVAVPISGAIASVITYIAYKLALNGAEELLQRTE